MADPEVQARQERLNMEIVQRLARIETKLDDSNGVKCKVDDLEKQFELVKAESAATKQSTGELWTMVKGIAGAVGILLLQAIGKLVLK